MILAIWVWPKSDLAAYNEHCSHGEPFESYQQFRDRIGEVIANSPYSVELVPMTVATMLRELAQRGLPNTPDNRAACVGGAKEKRIGVKIDHDAVGWTVIQQEGPERSGTITGSDAIQRLLDLTEEWKPL
jgi:hypothetical protein